MIRLKSTLLLMMLATVARATVSAAFCPDERTPFVGRTHSTGFAKKVQRNRNKPITIFTSPNDNADRDKAKDSMFGGDFHYFDEKDRGLLDELKQVISDQTNPYRELFGTKIKSTTKLRPPPAPDKKPKKPEAVHIILFNPNTDEEGVHTIEFPKGSGNNVILAFESKEECDRFSDNLKDQHFFEPVPHKIQLKTLEAYCNSLGVFVQVVPNGMDIRPPTENVLTFGHDPDLRTVKETLEYLFEMVEPTDEMDDEGAIVMMEDGWGGSWE